jgi:hypothetical protein
VDGHGERRLAIRAGDRTAPLLNLEIKHLDHAVHHVPVGKREAAPW